MAAIITTPFRVLNGENFKEDVADSNNSIYVAIGKSDAWSNSISTLTDSTPTVPSDHTDAVNEAYQQIIGMKRIQSTDVSHVVTRHDYADGDGSVKAWDSNDSNIYNEKFYVVTSEFKVYKCLKKGPGNTSVQPVHTGVNPVTDNTDGYTWKYMYTITTADSEKFLTKEFMPVKTLPMTVSSGTAATTLATTNVDYPQQNSQVLSYNSTSAAGIERIEVTAGGSGYTSAPTVVITGDGTTNAVATATVAGGAVTAINVTTKGKGFTIANISFTGGGGSDAAARAVIATPAGHGTDPVKELGAFFIALNSQLDSAENGDLTVGNDFRQISIIKNPFKRADNTDSGHTNETNGAVTNIVATAPTLKGLKYLQMASGASFTGFAVDQVINGGTSNAKAYLAEIDTTNERLYYYQNNKTGFKAFTDSGETITGSNPSGGSASSKSSNAVQNSEFVEGSGQMIFLENRAPISRTSSQIEDIKCIIEF